MKNILSILFVLCCLSACGQADLITIPSADVADDPVPDDPVPDPTPEISPKSLTDIRFVEITGLSSHALLLAKPSPLSLDVHLLNGEVLHGVIDNFSNEDLNGQVIWKSLNTDLAEVSPTGLVTGKKTGSTAIEAILLGFKSILEIDVQEIAATVDGLSGLSLLQQKYLIKENKSSQVFFNTSFHQGYSLYNIGMAEFKDHVDCDLLFQASPAGIVEVHEDGSFVPLKNGFTNLAVQCADQVATAIVEVKFANIAENNLAPKPEAEKIAEQILAVINSTNPANWIVGSSKSLTCRLEFNTGVVEIISNSFVTPAGSVAQVEWQSSDPEVVKIVGGTANLLKPGVATITLKYAGLTDWLDVVVKAVPLAAAGSDDVDHFLGPDDELQMVYGDNAGFGQGAYPQVLYGPPGGNTHVLSFGNGGELTITLHGTFIANGAGPDFTIFENPFQFGDSVFAERAQILVSEDGVNYLPFPCAVDDHVGKYPGCAGVHPVFANKDPLDPLVSGGDVFDLQDVGLESAASIRIKDLGTCKPGDPTYTNVCGAPQKEGFDFDALAILHGVIE